MEQFLIRESLTLNNSFARFANVAFSDGSLLHGFNQRFQKYQPLSAPNDIRRYFITPQEAGELCLLSGVLGKNRDNFFPKQNKNFKSITFSEIAVKFLEHRGYEAFICETEAEARNKAKVLIAKQKWPCFFFQSDTTGEKNLEEFYRHDESLDMARYKSIGIIKNDADFDEEKLDSFVERLEVYRSRKIWEKTNLVELFENTIPEFSHYETGKYLDGRM